MHGNFFERFLKTIHMKIKSIVPFLLIVGLILGPHPSFAMKRSSSWIEAGDDLGLDDDFDPAYSLWLSVGLLFFAKVLNQVNQWQMEGQIDTDGPVPEPFHLFNLNVAPSPNPAETALNIQHLHFSFPDPLPLVFVPLSHAPGAPSLALSDVVGAHNPGDLTSTVHFLLN